jgi:hypothetical protein
MGRVSHHRNIVVVYDAGSTAEGFPYLAMEYLPGGSLAGRLAAEGPLGWARVAGYGAGLAAALASAHEAGILHRDVKPANTLIGKDDEVKLCDFGIAALVDGTQTEMGVFKGTIAHAAPEVLDGGEASELSDVYSLGSMMYELVAGRPPYARDSDESVVALMTRALRDPVPDLGAHGAPPAFAAVVAEAMAKDPAERVPSAQALSEQLASVAASASAGDLADPAATVVVPGADRGADSTDPGAQPPAAVPPLPPPEAKPPVPPRDDEVEGSARGWPWPAVAAVAFGVLAVLALVAFLFWPDSSDGPGPGTSQVVAPTTPEQRVTTPTTAPTTTTELPVAQPIPSDATECPKSGVFVSPVTTCPFALNVQEEFLRTGSSTVEAFSPATGRTFTMTCDTTVSPVVCRGGDNAVVYFFVL